MLRPIWCLSAALLLSAVSQPAFADGFWTMSPMPTQQTATFMHTIGATIHLKNKTYDTPPPVVTRNRLRQTQPQKAVPALQPAKLTYTFSQARRNANLSMLKERYAKSDPSLRSNPTMSMLFSPEMFSHLDGEMRKIGLSSTNMADVMATHIAHNWQASQGGAGVDIPDAHIVALSKQMRSWLASGSIVQRMTDIQKQQSAEELLLQTIIVASISNEAKNNPSYRQAAERLSREVSKQLGIDLKSLELTAAGIGPAR